jgi:hypothetical protein
MPKTSNPLDQASALIRAGRMPEAQRILGPIIEANPHTVRAWLLASETWPDPSTRLRIVRTALEHNPDDPQLNAALAGLESQISAVPALPAAHQPQSPARPKLRAWQVLAACLAAIILVEAAGALFFLIQNRANCGNGLKPPPPLRVLFIGNSYTMVNDLPSTFTQLACSGGHRVEAGMAANGGWTLANHVASPETLSKLNDAKWDFVILQEQSQIPAQAAARTYGMYPAARQLVSKINATGAHPIFFMTWAHGNGWPESNLPDFASMQAQLAVGYQSIANELRVPVAPVGIAWSATRALAPNLQLWQGDESHPAVTGTYLAACVFYATLFRQSPAGLTYIAGLPSADAITLQQVAADTVLKEPRRWNLP